MKLLFILISIIALFVIIYLILKAESRNLSAPAVGDMVFIRGPFDPDNGWVKGMESAIACRGHVVSIDDAGILVRVENGESWHFSASELIVL